MNEVRPTLDYRSPADDGFADYFGQAIVAAGLTILAVVGIVFIFILATLSLHGEQAAVSTPIALGGGLAALGLSNWFAYRSYRNPRRRGIGLGIWIGLGVGLLIEGVCFTGIS